MLITYQFTSRIAVSDMLMVHSDRLRSVYVQAIDS